jgi:hypothetical protein
VLTTQGNALVGSGLDGRGYDTVRLPNSGSAAVRQAHTCDRVSTSTHTHAKNTRWAGRSRLDTKLLL